MLAKKYRFHSRGGVRFTYQKGKTIRTPKMSLVFNVNSRNHQRFAVVISKKVRMNLPYFKDTKDCIFVIYSKDIKDIDFETLIKMIRDLLTQSQTQ